MEWCLEVRDSEVEEHRAEIAKWCRDIEREWPLVILENLSPREHEDWILRRGRFAERVDSRAVRTTEPKGVQR